MTTVNQVDIGNLPNDAQGDPLRVAFQKINDNFDYLSSLAPDGPEGAIQYISDGLSAGNANLVLNPVTGMLDINVTTMPLVDAAIDLGSQTNRFSHLYLANSGVTIGEVDVTQLDAGLANTLTFRVNTGLYPQPASISVKDVYASGNVSVEGTLVIGNIRTDSVDVITYDNTAGQIVFETPVSGFDHGTFEITSRSMDDTNASSQKITLEVLRDIDNIGVRMTAFGTLFSGDPLTRYDADVAYGNVRIMVNPMVNQQIQHVVNYTINT